MMKKKRSVAWPYVLEILLVVIIIVAVMYIASPRLFENTLRFINETGLKVPSEAEFEPYVPDLNLPEDAQDVQKSVSVLRLAIESTAKGSLDNNPFPCEEVKTKLNNNKPKIEEQCLKCENEKGKFVCRVKAFELPQREDELGISGWREWITTGMGDPKYVLFYQQFPAGEEAAWQVDALDLGIKWMMLSAVLNAGGGIIKKGYSALKTITLPKVGVKLTGEGVERLGELTGSVASRRLTQEDAENLARGLKHEIKVSLPKRLLLFFTNFGRASKLLDEEILIRKAFIDSLIESRFGKSSLDFFDTEKVIASLGKDATQEEILKAVEDELLYTIGTKSVNGKLIRLVDVFESEDIVKQKVTAEINELREIIKATTKEQDADWLIAERRVLQERFPDEYGGTIHTIHDLSDPSKKLIIRYEISKGVYSSDPKEIGDYIRNLIDDKAYEISQRRSKGQLDDVLHQIAKENILYKESVILKRELTDELDAILRLDLQELRNLVSFRNFLSNMFVVSKIAGKESIVLNKKLVKKMIDDAVKVFPREKLQKRAAKQFDRILPALFDKEGKTFVPKLIGENIDSATKLKLEQEFLDEMSKSIIENPRAREVGNRILRNSFGADLDDTALEALKRQIPFCFKAGAAGAAIGGIGGKLGSGLGYLTAGGVCGVGKGALQHRYFMLLLLASYPAYLDSINEKNYPHGINTLVVSRPYLAVEEDDKIQQPGIEFPLSDALTDFYVGLEKGNKKINRFFLASPCKADLELTETNCICKAKSGDDLYHVAIHKGQHQLLKGTAIPENEEYVYVWDNIMKDAEREKIIDICAQSLDCAEIMLSNNKLVDEFIDYIYPIVLNAKKFMETYPDFSTKTTPMQNMHSIQLLRDPKEKDLINKISQDPNRIDFIAVRNGILVKYPERESIKKIVDDNGLMDREKFKSFIKNCYIQGNLANDLNCPINLGGPDFIYSAINSMYNARNDYKTDYDGSNRKPPYDDFFRKSFDPKRHSDIGDTIMWKTAREYVFHYRKITKFNSNLKNAVKSCNFKDTTTQSRDILEVLRHEKPIVQEVQITGPCIKVKANLDSSYLEQNKANYCYTEEYPGENVIPWITVAGFLVVDVLLPQSIPLQLISGFTAEAIIQGSKVRWPEHEKGRRSESYEYISPDE